MNYATSCKFCKRPITLTIDDDYHRMRDPHGLLPLAACNACADVRVWRRKLETNLRLTCRILQMAGKIAPAPMLARTRTVLTKLSQDYARMIAQWHHKDGMAWDEEVVSQLMDHPERWGEIITRLWHTFKKAQCYSPAP